MHFTNISLLIIASALFSAFAVPVDLSQSSSLQVRDAESNAVFRREDIKELFGRSERSPSPPPAPPNTPVQGQAQLPATGSTAQRPTRRNTAEGSRISRVASPYPHSDATSDEESKKPKRRATRG